LAPQLGHWNSPPEADTLSTLFPQRGQEINVSGFDSFPDMPIPENSY
jgi:hypothetical protein